MDQQNWNPSRFSIFAHVQIDARRTLDCMNFHHPILHMNTILNDSKGLD
jgi:hypothetical protein